MAACKKHKKIIQTESKSQKRVTVTGQTTAKVPVIALSDDGYYTNAPVWAFSKSDLDHQRWGLKVNENKLLGIIEKLRAYEGMTWRDILSDTSGRKRNPKNSEKHITQIINEARGRFQELNLSHEHDSIYSFSIDGATRLWGVRTGSIFYIVWIDPNHEIYPVEKSHT